jgi:hypothetical protein
MNRPVFRYGPGALRVRLRPSDQSLKHKLCRVSEGRTLYLAAKGSNDGEPFPELRSQPAPEQYRRQAGFGADFVHERERFRTQAWNMRGSVRVVNTPPPKAVASRPGMSRAIASRCSRDSMAHGPAEPGAADVEITETHDSSHPAQVQSNGRRFAAAGTI